MNFKKHLNQSVTYWPPGDPDDFGMPTFGAPVPIKCRWQDKAQLFRDTQGREVASSAIVYHDQPLLPGGYLFLGASAEVNPKIVTGAHEIRQKGSSPNLGATQTLYKVWL